MKYAIFFFVSLLTLNSTEDKTNTTTENTPFVVLQLFTSQGCSSCPSADAFLEIVKKDYASKNVIVLSYHVDYWNYLGWKDPFSKKEFTKLQYKYGQKLRARNVYTPQVVVNGKEHYVGSYKNKITNSITTNLKEKAENTLQLSKVEKNSNTISFNYNLTGDSQDKKIQVALVLENEITQVKRGENSNRTISNSNIVIATTSIKPNANNGSGSIKIPRHITKNKKFRLIGFIENTNLDITGATQVELN